LAMVLSLGEQMQKPFQHPAWMPSPFPLVCEFYAGFTRMGDEEVIQMLNTSDNPSDFHGAGNLIRQPLL
jgi:predicted phosphoribosyltransferase